MLRGFERNAPQTRFPVYRHTGTSPLGILPSIVARFVTFFDANVNNSEILQVEGSRARRNHRFRRRFPYHRAILLRPIVDAGLIAAFQNVALDFQRGRDEPVADRPRPLGHGDEAQLLVRIQLGVDQVHEVQQSLLNGRAL